MKILPLVFFSSQVNSNINHMSVEKGPESSKFFTSFRRHIEVVTEKLTYGNLILFLENHNGNYLSEISF